MSDEPEYDETTVAIFDAGEPYDLEAAVDKTIASATQIAWECGANSKAETVARVMDMLLIASVAVAHANGLSEEEFGDAMVEAWSTYETETEDDGGAVN